MFILAIDTSCDETSVAITWNDVILSNVLSSQVELHKKYGGVVPFLAQRAHRERIDAVMQEALKRAHSRISNFQFLISKQYPNSKFKIQNSNAPHPPLTIRGGEGGVMSLADIDLFAVTYGPGLAPALEVGVEKAKELARTFKKPLVAVDHMEGHIYANFVRKLKVQSSKFKSLDKKGINYPLITNRFPLLCLLISGNHTEIVLMKSHGRYEMLGETLDDACGEAFDKVGRMLGLGYPAGPIVERFAKEGYPFAYSFPIPLSKSKECDFSYSGLKTSVLYMLQKISPKGIYTKKHICDVCASFQRAAVEHLVQKTIRAVRLYCHCEERSDAAISNSDKRQGKIASRNVRNDRVKYLLLGGGVAANRLVRFEIRKAMKPFGIQVVCPTGKKLLCDNAAMIAVAAFYKARRKEFVKNISKLGRVPSLRLHTS